MEIDDIKGDKDAANLILELTKNWDKSVELGNSEELPHFYSENVECFDIGSQTILVTPCLMKLGWCYQEAKILWSLIGCYRHKKTRKPGINRVFRVYFESCEI
ncbi:hypothetical protein AU255_03010 [Methyloprofundus sedimenti]|uniref:Uncharacterized protein n=1 Tax=Methyloprofundus sedimenti TaxID=1420851 RepID=A0A1V8M5R3_9GAMM|nr:hypothetical protein [Methyloprofundus sedimenti]OQK16887.1 hypothetical protein AU255_03010 [Methyloprofundus sedimenti]